MIELKGSLRGVGLLPIVQMLAEVRETGRLRVSHGPLSGELDFEAGHLVAVAFGEEHGLAALGALAVAFPEADFEYLEAPAPAERNVDLTLDQLRAHLSHLGGNLETGNAVPSLRAVPRLVDSPNGYGQRLELERGSLRLLLAVDGARNVAEIIGDQPLVPALRELSELVSLGLIRIEPPAAPPAPVPSPESAQSTQSAQSAQPSVAAQPSHSSVPARAPEAVGLAAACPKLGFADDPGRRYSRPTGLHRCYAAEVPTLVTPQEQRELCLSSTYSACPRLKGHATAPQTDGVAHARAAAVPSPDRKARRLNAAPETWLSRVRSAPLLLAGGIGVSLLIAIAAVAVLFLRPNLLPPPTPAAPTAAAPAPAPPTQVQPTVVPPITQPAPTPAQRAAPPRPAAAVPTVAASGPAAASRAAQAAGSPPLRSQPPVGQPSSAQASTVVGQPSSAQASTVGGQTLLEARFTEAPSGWLDNPPFAHWADGAYRLLARDPGRFVAVAAPLPPQYSGNPNVIVSATMRKVGGPAGGGYGVIVRDQASAQRDGVNQSGEFFVLEVSDRGEVGVWRRNGETWVDILPWTVSGAVRPGGSPNDLVVEAIGERLVFQVNTVEVLNAQVEPSLDGGGVGLFVGGDANQVALDHFSVETPD